ncbi:MAG: enoyl-CoA hydratase-related protein [Rhodospirillales bacterium]
MPAGRSGWSTPSARRRRSTCGATGRTMTAEEAERCGLVSRIVPAERLQVEAMAVAARIASFSAPLVRMLKEAARHAREVASGTGLAHERRLFQLTFALEDRREGMAAFIEKRPPVYRDR